MSSQEAGKSKLWMGPGWDLGRGWDLLHVLENLVRQRHPSTVGVMVTVWIVGMGLWETNRDGCWRAAKTRVSLLVIWPGDPWKKPQ